jgi:hypothetical protein
MKRNATLPLGYLRALAEARRSESERMNRRLQITLEAFGQNRLMASATWPSWQNKLMAPSTQHDVRNSLMTAKPQPVVQQRHRSAETGRFVLASFAARNPMTTERDRMVTPSVRSGATRFVYQSTVTGSFVSEAYARLNPRTTVRVRVPVR